MRKITLPKLKAHREANGWTQETLAECAGISLRTVQRIEAGGNTNGDNAKSIASALNLASYHVLSNASPEQTDAIPVSTVGSTQNKTQEEPLNETVRRAIRRPTFYMNLLSLFLALEFAPVYFWGAGDTNLFGRLILGFGMILLSAIGSETWRGVAFTQTASIVIVLILLWFNSTPTSGWATVFYSDEQVDVYREVAAIKELGDELQRKIETYQATPLPDPLNSEKLTEMHQEKDWSQRLRPEIDLSESGIIKQAIHDQRVCQKINAIKAGVAASHPIPRCGTPDAEGLPCCEP